MLRVRFTPHPEVVREPMRLVVPTGGVNAPDVGVNVGVNERQRWFLEQVGKGTNVKAQAIAERFGVAVRTAERDITALRDAELVAFVGAPKTGRYVLLEHRRVGGSAAPDQDA